MPDRLDTAFLHSECSRELTHLEGVRAQRIASRLGPLAPLWMTSDALEIAGLDGRPLRLPATVKPGAFHALVVTCGSFPVLRPSFALPLRWGRDREHSRRLPASLHELADAILALHKAESGGISAGQWGLSLDFQGASEFDLSGLEFDGSSAMAAMFAALDLAVANIEAIGTVLASLSCLGDDWWRVEGVDAKLDAALAAGATRVFLWIDNEVDGDVWEKSRGRTDFVQYLSAKPSLRESLAPFLKELEAPPPPTASLDDHAKYYERAMTGRTRGSARRDYYLKTLVGPLASKCGDDPGVQAIRGSVRCLIGCIAPGMPPTVSLVARLLKPEIVRLVHSPLEDEEDGQLAGDVKAIIKHLGAETGVRSVEPLPLDLVKLPLRELAAKIAGELTALSVGGRREPGACDIVIDITNGTRRLLLAILEALPPGVRCVFVDSNPTRNGVHRIGSERIEIVDSDGA